jgi:hypothetical protein
MRGRGIMPAKLSPPRVRRSPPILGTACGWPRRPDRDAGRPGPNGVERQAGESTWITRLAIKSFVFAP